MNLALNGRPVDGKNFTWDIAFNISHNVNRITELYGGRSVASGFYNFTVGHDLQSFYLRQWAGVDPANGDPLWYTDSTHRKQPIIIPGNSQLNHSAAPKYLVHLQTPLHIKELVTAVQFNYNFGNYVLDGWGSYTSAKVLYLGSFNQLSNQLNAWQKEVDVTNTPKVILWW